MNFRGNAWLATTFNSIFGGQPTSEARRELGARLRRSARRDVLMAYETLETRVVLWSGGGPFGAGALIQDLNNLGVLSSPVIAGSMSGATSTNATVAQLQTDQQALETELQGLSVKSNLGAAPVTKLLTDSAALGQDWYGIDPSKLQQAVGDLTAAATGSTTVTTASAQNEFVGLFPSSDQAPATTVFTDLSTIVSASGVAASDLSTVASDQAAVQKDLTNLSPFGGGGGGGGGGGYGFESSLGIGEGQAASALTSALENVGVFTSPITTGSTTPPTSTNTLVAQLQTDQNALQTELQSLASKTGVTVGDLTQLSLDSQALDMAIRGVSPSALQQAVSDVASAATGSSTVTSASASSEFTGLFPSSDQAAATSVYNDLVKIVTDSGVSGTDLSTVAADEATIQTDLSNLQNGNSGAGGFHGGGGGGGGGGGSSRLVTSILNNIGVMTGPINTTPTSSNTLVAQLQTDEEALATELQGLASKSGVTASDLTQLNTDSQALAAGLNGVTTAALEKALSDLAAAATGSTTISSASASSEFTGLFPTSDAAAVATVYNDLVKIVNDSGVTSTDLTTVASDQADIQTDLNNLHGGSSNGTTITAGATTTTLSAGSSGGTGSSGSGGGTSGGGSTGGTGKAHHRKVPPPRRHRRL